MDKLCTYQIEIRGQVDVSEINVMSPVEMSVEWVYSGATLLAVHTDQSGLIGLIRHLHGLGFVLLSLHREG